MKKKTPKKTKKSESNMSLEFSDHVYIVERKNKKVKRTLIEDELVLNCVVLAIEEGITLLEQDKLSLKEGEYEVLPAGPYDGNTGWL
jgi:hypothetical protein